MGAGEQIKDDFASTIVKEAIKTRQTAEKLGLTGATTQADTDKLFTFVSKAIRKEAEPYSKDSIKPERNPAITAFQRIRDRVSAESQQVKTVDQYIERLAQEYRKEMDRVKKQGKLRSDAKLAGENLCQYWDPESSESQGRQLASIPTTVNPRKPQL